MVQRRFSHRFHRSSQMLGCADLPQNPQISEARVPSRGCTCLRSALPLARARSAPTEQMAPTEQEVHCQLGWCSRDCCTNLRNAHQQTKSCATRDFVLECYQYAVITQRGCPSKKILAKCLLVSQLMRTFTPRNRNPHAERVLCGHRHYYPYILLARA